MKKLDAGAGAEGVRADDESIARAGQNDAELDGQYPPFPGAPPLYRRLAIYGSIGIHLYLFVGFYVVKNFVAGESWPANWTVVVVGLLSTVLFARFSYRWIMRLDGQYGSGSGWDLESTQVKLPWQRQRH